MEPRLSVSFVHPRASTAWLATAAIPSQGSVQRFSSVTVLWKYLSPDETCSSQAKADAAWIAAADAASGAVSCRREFYSISKEISSNVYDDCQLVRDPAGCKAYCKASAAEQLISAQSPPMPS